MMNEHKALMDEDISKLNERNYLYDIHILLMKGRFKINASEKRRKINCKFIC